MPKLGKVATTKLYLPSTKDEVDEQQRAWVLVKQEMLVGDLIAVSQETDDMKRVGVLLFRLIKDWNFTKNGEADGEKLDITLENMDEFTQGDFQFLTEWINDHITASQEGLTEDEKKTSSPTSIQVTEARQPTI